MKLSELGEIAKANPSSLRRIADKASPSSLRRIAYNAARSQAMAKPTPLDAALVAASIGGGLVAYKRGKSEGKSEVKKAMTPNKIAGLRRAASRPDGNSWLRRYASSRLEQASVGQGIKNPLYMRRDPTFGAQVRSRGRNARTRTEQYGPTPNPTRLGTPMRPLP